MPESVINLGDRASIDVHVEKAAISPVRTIAFWKALDEEKRRWERVLADVGTGVTDDHEVQWTPAFLQEYERVQRNLWQRLRGIELEGTINGPDKAEYKATGSRRDGTLFWTPDAGQPVQSLAQKRINTERSNVISLGHSLTAVEGGLPVRRTLNLGQQYGPITERFVAETETQHMFHHGMDYILGQVFDAPQDHEHSSAPLLRNLKGFRKDHARWATLQGRGIVALESGSKNDAWMAVVPQSSEILLEQIEQKHTAMVRREPGGVKLMRVLPMGFTREWAGLVGVHELEHLENAYTGKEPEHATRDEYIEGEIRAYSVEIGAANILSCGRFTQTMDAMIDLFKWRTYGDIRSMHNSPMMLILANNLDTYITPNAPKSQAEARLRLGLYSVAVGFRLAEREAAGDPEKDHRLKKELIAALYGEGGAGII